jgi:hypothetical protein
MVAGIRGRFVVLAHEALGIIKKSAQLAGCNAAGTLAMKIEWLLDVHIRFATGEQTDVDVPILSPKYILIPHADALNGRLAKEHHPSNEVFREDG